MSKITGVTWAFNGLSQDYCLQECIDSLKQCCDEVVVLDAGSTDGTAELIKSFEDSKTKIVLCANDEWRSQKGKWKLSYFTNKALKEVQTDWFYYQQADEIIHEKSYPFVRAAIHGDSEGYLLRRINLWGDPYQQLNVVHNRLPCSEYIVRIAKTGYESYDDAESIAVIPSDRYANDIRMYHLGFVRKREVHPNKIRHMQGEVFECGVDAKLEGMEIFDPWKWFDKTDVVPIREPLPSIIQEWAAQRVYED